MTKTALLVVDVQNDFLPGGSLPVPAGDEVVAAVNALMDGSDFVILTADWHPAGHCSFASSHPGKAAYESVVLPYGEQVLWPDHCVAGAKGAEFAPGLDTAKAAAVIRKGMNPDCDSYSGFIEADRKTPTGLAGLLRELGVGEVRVCGLALDFCVAWTAIDAARAGFRTSIVTGASRAIGEESLRAARDAWRRVGVSEI